MSSAFTLIKNQEATQPFHFNYSSPTGEIIFVSENYTSKASALNGIESVRENSQDESNYDLRESTDEKFYFVIIAQNNEIIGRSVLKWESNKERDKAIKSMMVHAHKAKLDDQTAKSDSKVSAAPSKSTSGNYA